MKRHLCLIAILTIIGWTASAQPVIDESIRLRAEAAVRKGLFPSLVIGLVQDGRSEIVIRRRKSRRRDALRNRFRDQDVHCAAAGRRRGARRRETRPARCTTPPRLDEYEVPGEHSAKTFIRHRKRIEPWCKWSLTECKVYITLPSICPPLCLVVPASAVLSFFGRLLV